MGLFIGPFDPMPPLFLAFAAILVWRSARLASYLEDYLPHRAAGSRRPNHSKSDRLPIYIVLAALDVDDNIRRLGLVGSISTPRRGSFDFVAFS